MIRVAEEQKKSKNISSVQDLTYIVLVLRPHS